MRSESLHQRTPKQPGQPTAAPSMRGAAQPAQASLSEQYRGWMSNVHHPDIGMLREIVKSQVTAETSYSEIENQVFSLFKETPDFAILKHDMVDAVGQLASLFDEVPVQAATIKKRLTEILNRATITADSSPQDFGNQKVNVVQLSCLRFKQIAELARQLKHSPAVTVDIKSYLGHVKDCVKNIAADYSVCGPGVVQKVEDEFSVLRLKLFPPSIARAVTETKDYLAKQIVINFCNEKYGFNDRTRNANAIPIGNQIHYVAAWQDRLIESYPEFAHLPKNDDPFAPRLPYDGPHTLLLQELMRHISHGATEVHACRFMVESVFQEIRSHLGEKVENINDNFSAFNEVLQQIQTRFPGLSADHFLQTDDLFNYSIRQDTNHATLLLLKALPANRFCPLTLWKGDGLQFKMFADLAWLESSGSAPGEAEVDFDLTPDSFFRNLDASRSGPGERIAQLLPVISFCLFRKNPADRVQFFSQILQAGFGVNPIAYIGFSLENLKSQSDASRFITACLYLIANSSSQPHLNEAHSLRSLLQWHDKSNAISKYFGNPDLVIETLTYLFLSNNSLKNLFSFVLDMKNPDLAYKVLTTSRFWPSQGRAISKLLRIDPWKREAAALKNEAKTFLKTPAYLAAKAAQSNEFGRELKSLSPRALIDMMFLGKPECLDFALRHGLSPNTLVTGMRSPISTNGSSLLQLAIETNNVQMVGVLLNRRATREQSCLSGGVRYDARDYLELKGQELPNYQQIASLLDN